LIEDKMMDIKLEDNISSLYNCIISIAYLIGTDEMAMYIDKLDKSGNRKTIRIEVDDNRNVKLLDISEALAILNIACK